ncbi:hypothetical protein BDP27DRAFT_1447711 [Rhodocollybia butyracea]|uniref:Uncharacterized protein n=1 Tax=Rhodocollybia butyracea TaxID=206335 RepID=A0A9P5PWL2_9AGAR|nr:hypothetical protein BDP27DRAFT_1447711 [Rhodocollybia butyracea]
MIWTRNTETSNLQAKHIDLDPHPQPGATPTDPPFIQLNLRDRKNWQKKEGKNETQLNGHKYNCYPQKIWAICVYTHLQIWMKFSEMHILCRNYEPDDFIFPTINANGITIQSTQPITPEAVQKMISKFTDSAGTPGAFTMHCFRRGGAQFRFMFASIGEQWTLAQIRWWGGWASNEKWDTLIRYLLDELNTYEEDHSDALAPIDRKAYESHASEAAEMAPLSTSEGCGLFKLVDESIKTQFSVAFSHFLPRGAPQGFAVSQFSSPLVQGHYLHFPASFASFTQTHQSPPLAPFLQTYAHQFLPSVQRVPFSNPSSLVLDTVSVPYATGPSKATYAQLAATVSHPSKSSGILLPGLAHLPVIPKISPGPDAWKQVILDWDKADPVRDHHYALKNWKVEWAKETKLSAHYGQQKMIALEFINIFGRDEAAFTAAYPMHGIQQLMLAIRNSHQDRGLVKRCKGKHLGAV